MGKKASDSVSMMLNMPESCSVCQKAFDRKSKEMAQTWFVEVYSNLKQVILTCPECSSNREKNNENVNKNTKDSDC